MTEYKLGRLPYRPDDRDLLYAKYRVPVEVPATFGFDAVEPANGWGMLGNDTVGDCTCADAGHEHIVYTGARLPGTPRPDVAKFDTKGILNMYSAITGYNGNPNTDTGAEIRTVLQYRKATGTPDTSGAPHKIAAYLKIDHTNEAEVKQALYEYGALCLGVNLPDSAMTQFNNAEAWTVVSGTGIDGGHCVPLVGWRHYLECVTWGRLQPLTLDWFREYVEEAWIALSEDWLRANGDSPRGLDWTQLQSDLASL